MNGSTAQIADEVRIVEINGVGLETHIYYSSRSPAGPTMVLLHEGLGSVAAWGKFPARIVKETGLPAVIYSRSGYGKSDRRFKAYEPDFMHQEALAVLPVLLAALEIVEPILIGHSDGGSIALIYAANHPVKGVVVEAPHIFVEDITIKAIQDLSSASPRMNLIGKLGYYHDDPQHAFEGWKNIWLDPEFRDWNIFDQVMRITSPILAIQGKSDKYGTMAQIDGIAANALGPVTLSKLDQCGHSPHRDQMDLVVGHIVNFVERIR